MARNNKKFMNSEGRHHLPFNPKFGKSAGKPNPKSALFKFDVSGFKDQTSSQGTLPAATSQNNQSIKGVVKDFTTALSGNRGSVDKSKVSMSMADKSESKSRITNTEGLAIGSNHNVVSTSGDDGVPLTDGQLLEQMLKRTDRSMLQNHYVMMWLRTQAKAPKRVSILKERYYRRTGEILADKQIMEMFNKLDTDGSNAISMQEMTELFVENGLAMSTNEIAQMFSVVKKINDAEWLEKSGAKQ
jgi:hypothetical protein